MGRTVAIAAYVLALVAVIVTVDVLFLRHHVWARLAVNVGIVAVWATVYLVFVKRVLGR